MKLLTLLTPLIPLTMASNSNETAPVAPKMTLLYRMEALLGDRFSLGSIPTGQERIVIPIVGGTFKGPKLSGMHFQTPAPSL